jgi:uncharacterized FlaG/YvyC family protein
MPDKISNLGGYIRTSDKTKSSAVQTERMSAIPNPIRQAQITSAVPLEIQKLPDITGSIQKGKTVLSEGESKLLLESLNKIFRIFGIEARYYIDPATDYRVIQLREIKTQKLISQIPDDEFLNRVTRTRTLIGLLFDEKV